MSGHLMILILCYSVIKSSESQTINKKTNNKLNSNIIV